MQGKGLFFVNDTESSYRLKLFLEQFHIRSAVLNAELPLNSRLHILQARALSLELRMPILEIRVGALLARVFILELRILALEISVDTLKGLVITLELRNATLEVSVLQAPVLPF